MTKQLCIALHGFTGAGADFDPLIQIKPDWEWVTPHLEDATPFQQRDNIILLGYSMGGRVALQRAFQYRERISQLILIGASPGLKTEAERQQRLTADTELATTIIQKGTKRFIDDWQSQPLIASQQRIPEPWRTLMLRRRYCQAETALANSLLSMSLGKMPNLWPRLSDLEMPVCLVTGDEDTKFTAIAKEMTLLIPHCRHVIIPNAGHAAHLENLAAFAKSCIDAA